MAWPRCALEKTKANYMNVVIVYDYETPSDE